jgi:hypothetical protein
MKPTIHHPRFCAVLAAASISSTASAQDGASADLAQELANPVADLISIPIQFR